MQNTTRIPVDRTVLANSMASFLQIAAVVLLTYVCFKILSPFLSIVTWGIIIAVAVYPGHVALTARLGGNGKLSAILIALVGIAIIVVPTWTVGGSTIDSIKTVADSLAEGTLTVPLQAISRRRRTSSNRSFVPRDRRPSASPATRSSPYCSSSFRSSSRRYC